MRTVNSVICVLLALVPTSVANLQKKLDAAPEVQAAFSKWLRPNDLVQVTEGPAPQ